MPKTEAPKTPEQNEKPQKPSSETRVRKNETAEDALQKRLDKETREYVIRKGKIVQPVLDEGNRGEEAWHKAHKERNTPKPGETNTEKKKREDDASRKIDAIRAGEGRKYSTRTLRGAIIDKEQSVEESARRGGLSQ